MTWKRRLTKVEYCALQSTRGQGLTIHLGSYLPRVGSGGAMPLPTRTPGHAEALQDLMQSMQKTTTPLQV
jgi:hypothetical protein